jgi:phosphoribosylamine--glycine ligase
VRVLIVGSGGREHALAWRLSQSPLLDELHAAPGNPGIAQLGDCHPVRADDVEAVLELTMTLEPDLVVIGPETPLVYGLGGVLRHCGFMTFGPSLEAARIEGSKLFAKEVMHAAGVPTAAGLSDPSPPCVIKANNLAAGKGVFVCRTQAEVDHAMSSMSAFDAPEDHPSPPGVVIEELLQGKELSVFALCDGLRAVPLGAARDFKRVGDGDTGPNTGGMGAFSPVSEVPASEVEELVERIHQPVVDELSRRGTPFAGLLYAGLMLTDDGPRVLEFNCRFGDPETQALLPRIEGDLLAALAAAAAGELPGMQLRMAPASAVTIVLAAGAYPEGRDTGSPITGIADAEALGALVFHAGTARRGGELVTSGGRILNVTATGNDLEQARALAYDAAEAISFDGVRYRRDIGLAESRVAS